jgi:murein DD-endopeptidase MepM/ murein hydrolase activator NlpD
MNSKSSRFLSIAAWILAASLVVLAVYLGWNTWSARAQMPTVSSNLATSSLPTSLPQVGDGSPVTMPVYGGFTVDQDAVSRQVSLYTIIPNRPRQEVKSYVVDLGDSVFEIASSFNITPETLLWANYDLLNDNPDMISVGMELKIPPVDGVYYQWQENDTVESIAARFEADPKNILGWSGNGLDLTNPEMEPGSWVMVPGGHREFRQWIIPVIPRGRAGVSRELYGAGACQGGYDGAYGTGGFIWPAGNHSLSGNDYWSGHLGVDIAAGEGAQIYAADSGVVVFAGWANGGYGNMVMIDHGNGYQSLYAHMSQVSAACGQSVSQGQTIGYSGSTGNSTGAHLHFEVRYQGGFVSPWYVLPVP